MDGTKTCIFCTSFPLITLYTGNFIGKIPHASPEGISKPYAISRQFCGRGQTAQARGISILKGSFLFRPCSVLPRDILSQSDKLVLRSQLDCFDSRLPGTGVFDIKTRAVTSIRHDQLNFKESSGYQIRTLNGLNQSFEREYYDLIRSAFLKYR